jgi:shikimate dehydrogenase
MRRFGIIGNPLEHSFSPGYFSTKFEKENIPDAVYDLFLLDSIEQLPDLLYRFPDIIGLNVTFPYKESIIPFLDEMDKEAEEIGSVNTIKVREGKLTGFNTDAAAFEQTIEPIKSKVQKALVLGTGGASKAICYIMDRSAIGYWLCSRIPGDNQIAYHMVDREIVSQCNLIINTTPLGMYPDVHSAPDIPYEHISVEHILYDLVYNPQETEFLKRGKMQGATIKNGLEMLHNQADLSWKIFSEEQNL